MVEAGRPSVRAIVSVQSPFIRLSRMISFSLGVSGPNELTMGLTENLPAFQSRFQSRTVEAETPITSAVRLYPRPFWKQSTAACRFSGGKVIFMAVSKKRGAASVHGTPPFTRQSMPLPDVAETNVPTPVFLHVAAVLLFEVNVGVGVVGPVEVGTDADFVIRAADVVLHRGAH